MNITKLFSLLSVLAVSLGPELHAAPKPPKVDFSRLVVVGDSLSAGFQNFSLLDSQQVHGYANLVAQQAGTSLTLPLVPYPGAPNVLALVTLGPSPQISPVPGTLPMPPRDNPTEQPTDLAVPGVTIAQVLSQRPNPAATSPIDQLGNIVLGYPTPFVTAGPARTQIEQAIALRPTAVIAWAGSNDALMPALTENLLALTSVDDFHTAYKAMLDALAGTNATLITANIPDVTEVAYFEPISELAAKSGLPVATVAAMLGAGEQDYLRISGLSQAQAILTGQATGPLTTCPSPTPGTGPAQIPCLLTASDVQQLKAVVASYNNVIATEAAAHGAVLVDIHALVDNLYSQGIVISGQRFTTDYFGGLFSLDGFHPTNTGYAIIANAFIDTINQQRNTKIPDVSLDSVIWLDPFTYLRYITQSSN